VYKILDGVISGFAPSKRIRLQAAHDKTEATKNKYWVAWVGLLTCQELAEWTRWKASFRRPLTL